MTVNKRLVAYHVGRLSDRDPQVRLKAIQELKLLEDADALEPLQALFRTDPNPEVRRAAQDAGRSIFVKQQTGKRP